MSSGCAGNDQVLYIVSECLRCFSEQLVRVSRPTQLTADSTPRYDDYFKTSLQSADALITAIKQFSLQIARRQRPLECTLCTLRYSNTVIIVRL